MNVCVEHGVVVILLHEWIVWHIFLELYLCLIFVMVGRWCGGWDIRFVWSGWAIYSYINNNLIFGE